ncbi:hypothetical protein QF037_000697 [Streptomyces canus]|uniref:hypothetical protein n=1 Tax=Streptomyces canus TaxID=58343 RepID=UPI0027896FBD|nr:hypothetical protein [Streptomyces canus]MDQ0596352.1 hypothetical protein [Streptomyces canus]
MRLGRRGVVTVLAPGGGAGLVLDLGGLAGAVVVVGEFLQEQQVGRPVRGGVLSQEADGGAVVVPALRLGHVVVGCG